MGFCNKCGTKMPDNSKFCSACGTKVISVSTPTDETPLIQESSIEKPLQTELSANLRDLAVVLKAVAESGKGVAQEKLKNSQESLNKPGNKQETTYPIVKRTNNGAIGEILASLFFGAIVINLLMVEIENLRYNYGSWFSLLMWIVLLIGFLVLFLIGIGSLKVLCYELDCPVCKQKTVFPVNDKSYNCTCCSKKLIMDNGIIRPVN